MKRVMSLLLSLMLLIGMVSFASADTLPDDILNQIGRNDVVLSSAQLGMTDGMAWFLLARTWTNENVLYLFKQYNKAAYYRLVVRNSLAVPPDTNLVISLKGSEVDQWTQETIAGPLLVIDQVDNTGYTVFHMAFQYKSGDTWELVRIWDSKGNYQTLSITDGRVSEYRDYRSQTIKSSYVANFDRTLTGFNLSQFALRGSYQYDDPEPTKKPPAYSAVPVAMPDSEEFMPMNSVEFPANKRYAVYSGPNEESIRGANKKAVVSTNDWIQVFGVEGDWALVHYGIGKNHYRFGYIKRSALPNVWEYPELRWRNVRCKVQESVIVTDDPLFSQAELTRLEPDTEITWLGVLGDWAYIEGQNFRGFILMSKLYVMGDIGEPAEAIGEAAVEEP